jgi:hypothetical protein
LMAMTAQAASIVETMGRMIFSGLTYVVVETAGR